MEAIIAVVGFLGAGKTTLLKHLVDRYRDAGWNPYVILNDYENAYLDIQQLEQQIEPQWTKALSGSCICCSGIAQLRDFVNGIPEREKGITLIEANGTSDACSLMGFLGVGIDKRFLPPIQVSVVDVKNWQLRGGNGEVGEDGEDGKNGEYNELEASQIQVSSLMVLTHIEHVSDSRLASVKADITALNPLAKIVTIDELDISLLPELESSQNMPQAFEHQKAHWSSCSVDLPHLPDKSSIQKICDALPMNILRIKGCAIIGQEEGFTYFERTPDGAVFIRPFNGVPVMGAKLLIVGPGSEPALLEKVIADSIR